MLPLFNSHPLLPQWPQQHFSNDPSKLQGILITSDLLGCYLFYLQHASETGFNISVGKI